MPVRQANAVWKGSLQGGTGNVSLGSGAYDGQYSFSSRFEDGVGTNPEELIAAAHAGCYAMALSGGLGKAGFEASSIEATAKVHVNKKPEGGFIINQIDLVVEAEVPGISAQQFQEIAEATKTGCPVSVALGAVENINLTATLR